jgi:hypothetical protein
MSGNAVFEDRTAGVSKDTSVLGPDPDGTFTKSFS